MENRILLPHKHKKKYKLISILFDNSQIIIFLDSRIRSREQIYKQLQWAFDIKLSGRIKV